MLKLDNVTKLYEMGEVAVSALAGVSLSLEQGCFLSVVGKSGSGKSTLLHIIGGLDEATSGSVVVDGVDITHMKEKQLAEFRAETSALFFSFST